MTLNIDDMREPLTGFQDFSTFPVATVLENVEGTVFLKVDDGGTERVVNLSLGTGAVTTPLANDQFRRLTAVLSIDNYAP